MDLEGKKVAIRQKLADARVEAVEVDKIQGAQKAIESAEINIAKIKKDIAPLKIQKAELESDKNKWGNPKTSDEIDTDLRKMVAIDAIIRELEASISEMQVNAEKRREVVGDQPVPRTDPSTARPPLTSFER